MIGKHLSHYLIESELGRGGMGIVYRAKDTKLNRTVAVKVLPSAALATDEDRARFYREAQSAAQLHHPNIATIFEIDEAVPEDAPHGTQPSPFIAMEFVDGETLHDYIAKGPLKLTEAVQVATQVAEGLKAAHAKDIVHRDIKSANVMLTEDGIAKVLDFGLAKTNQSTMLTRLGSTLGTVAYMSPEQARGQEVDSRTDLYSLGAMLYEMIVGQPPFAGEYEQAVVYSILNENPEPLTSRRTGVPVQLERIVNKLMAKEADYRYQTAADLIADLKTVDVSGSGLNRRGMPAVSVISDPDSPAIGDTQKTATISKFVVAVGVASLVIGFVAAWLLKPAPELPVQPPVRFQIEVPESELFSGTGRRIIAISPDGSSIAYTADGDIFVRHTSDLSQVTRIPTAGVAREPMFSPDSRQIAYEDADNNQLMRVSVAGGFETPISDLTDRVFGGMWGADGYIYLGFGDGGMGRVAESGGSVSLFALPDDSNVGGYHGPWVLPGGEAIVYTLRYSGLAWSQAEIRYLNLETGDDRLIHKGGTDARFLSSGHLIFEVNSTLYSIPFDPNAGQVLGSQTPVMDDVATSSIGTTGSAHYSISENGTLVKVRGSSQALLAGGQLAWGSLESIDPISPDAADYTFMRISPDGRQVAAQTGWLPPNTRNIHLLSVARGTSTLFEQSAGMPVWSPDGLRLAFGSGKSIIVRDLADREVRDTIYVGTDGIESVDPTDWSADGQYLLINLESEGAMNSNISYLDLESGQLHTFLSNDVDNDYARISPDGRWLVYEFGPPGGSDVVVRPFPDGEGSLTVATGASKPIWRRDGRAILYSKVSDHRVFETEIFFDPFSTGETRRLTSNRTGLFGSVDEHPLDGRILIISDPARRSEEENLIEGQTIDVIVNWTGLLPGPDKQ